MQSAVTSRGSPGTRSRRTWTAWADLASEGRFSPEGLPRQIRIDVNANRGISRDGPMTPLRRFDAIVLKVCDHGP